MPRKPIKFNLDFMKKDIFSRFTVKQFDDVTFTITPKMNNEPYDTSNMTGIIYVGVNGEMFKQDTNITVSSNSIVVTLDKNMLNKDGRVYAEIELTDSIGTVTSSSFIFDIDRKIGEGAIIPGAIDGFVEKYKKLTEEFKKQFQTYTTDLNNRFNTLTSEKQQDAEVIDARKGEISLRGKIDKIDEQFNTIKSEKADKNTTNNIQQQVNNLVLGAVGDGNNAEVIQAREEFNTLNDRLQANDYIASSIYKGVSKNLFVTTSIESGKQLSAYGDLTSYNATYSFVTDYIKIQEDIPYLLDGWAQDTRLAIYNSSKSKLQVINSSDLSSYTYINKVGETTDKKYSILIPKNTFEDVKYVRFTCLLSYLDSTYFIKGTEYVKEPHIVCKVPYLDKAINEINTSIDEINSKLDTNNEYKIIIDCFGDSLTMGAGGNGQNYPNYLQTLLGEDYIVNNYGIGGEKVNQIMARQGSTPALVQPCTIVANSSTVVDVNDIYGNTLGLLARQSLNGMSPITLKGNVVSLYWNSDLSKQTIVERQGNTIEIARPTPLVMKSNSSKNHILIAFVGQNGWGTDNIEDLVNMQKKMVEYNENGKYLIIGLHSNKSTKELELLQAHTFGYNYINLRYYLSKYGLDDAGLSPTDSDTTAMAQGKCPPSLLSDGLHFTQKGYEVLANLIHTRGQELGYW